MAHSWYDSACCSDKDCEPVPIDAIEQDGKGWTIDYDSPRLGHVKGSVPEDLVKDSMDGGFHVCLDKEQKIICFYRPLAM